MPGEGVRRDPSYHHRHCGGAPASRAAGQVFGHTHRPRGGASTQRYDRIGAALATVELPHTAVAICESRSNTAPAWVHAGRPATHGASPSAQVGYATW